MTTWKEYYHLMARYQYAVDTLRKLEEAGHILVCPQHGPPGCGAGLTEDQATALSYRGYLDGGDRMSYRRLCERCAASQIQAEGERLWRGMQS